MLRTPRGMALLGRRNFAYEAGPITTAPVLGDEILLNGSMEAGSPPSSWSADLGAVLTAVADERTGGSGAQSINIKNGIANSGVAYQNVTLVSGDWYQLAEWSKLVTGSASRRCYLNTAVGLDFNSSGAGWVYKLGTGRATAAANTVNLLLNSATVDHESRSDDVSLKRITLASMFSGGGSISFQNGSCQGDVTLTAGTQAGIALLNDAGTLGVIAYHDGTTARLYRIGTEPTAISGAAAYAAARTIKVVRSGDTFQLYYNAVQIGSDTVISGLPTLTQLKAFSTYATNSIQNMRAAPG